MSLFSETTRGLVAQKQNLGTPRYLGPSEDPVARELSRVVPQYARQIGGLLLAEKEREQAFEDTSFVSATQVAQNRFDFNLKRELGRFYTSDGRDGGVPEDYRADLGFGVTLEAKDFIETGQGGGPGVRRKYVDMVHSMHDRFMEVRGLSAPSEKAQIRSKIRMEAGQLNADMKAHAYSQARRGMRLANALNTVVRAYKETIADKKGFSVEDFGSHFESARNLAMGAGIDQGKARLAFLGAVGDMVKVGVTEAHTDKDNQLALAVLAATPARGTEMVQKAVLGLEEKDKAYLSSKIRMARESGGFKKYRTGSNAPGDANEYLPWFLSQLDIRAVDEMKQRSLKAMVSQTQVARNGLDMRLQGLTSALTSSQVKNPGFREMVRNSLANAASEINELYPRKFFPEVNARKTANALVVGEVLEMRRGLDGKHSNELLRMARDGSMERELFQKITSRLSGEGGKILSLPVSQEAAKVVSNFISSELKLRQEDPYGSIIRTTKDVRELDRKLKESNYVEFSEKARDQAVLRRRVLQRAGELGVRPSFLSGVEATSLSNMAALGNTVLLGDSIRGLRQKYGDISFFDYIVPELSRDKKIGEQVLKYSMIPNAQVSDLVLQAATDSQANAVTIKDLGFDEEFKDAFTKKMAEGTGWLDWMWEDRPMERINNAITDRFGDGAMGTAARTSLIQGVKDLAIALIARGERDVGAAIDRAVMMVEQGLGERVELEGRETLAFPGNMLNQPRLERLAEVLRNPRFLDKEILPHIGTNPYIEEMAKMEKVSSDELKRRYFTDEDIVSWGFGAEGLYPRVENYLMPDLSSGVPRKDGGAAFVIPYGELPSLLYWKESDEI